MMTDRNAANSLSTAIPAANPKASYLLHRDEIDQAVARVLTSGWYILGPETESFETEFACFTGARWAVGVGSGTAALCLSLRACGVSEGDEVITVSHTAVATVAAIDLLGARPVLVDIDPSTYTIDASLVEAAVTDRTKAIVPVHLYGHPAELTGLLSIADKHGLRVVEDCAQAAGAEYHGQKVGAWGDMAAFSFYPTKNLGALGDAGMIVTDDEDLANSVRQLRQYGWQGEQISRRRGTSSRLDELQSAILRVKLRYLDQENARRAELAGRYCENLAATHLVLPVTSPHTQHAYHLFVVRSSQRDALQTSLAEQGIKTLVHYPVPVHEQPGYATQVLCRGSLRQSEKAAREVLSLPMFPELTDEAVDKVSKSIWAFERK